jgi:bacillolysin
MVHDYWRNVRSRNSWNNAGGSLLSYINADLVAINPAQFTNNDNAFWDGSRMTYGRGTTWEPFTTLDITSHEIAHGICDNLVGGSGMTYASESGAIEEGLSDIWAAVVEQASVTGKQTWLLGEDATFGIGLRDLANPHNSAQPQPNTYMNSATVPTNYWVTAGCSPDNSNDQCGVHRNSGVMNRWFFLLSQGGSGFNNGLSSTAASGAPWQVSGIGIANAATIVFRAEDSYFTAGTTYPNARTYTIQAARDIFGVNSCQEIAVTNAWNAVGVGAKFVYPSVTISGPALLCTSGTYSLSATPAGTTVTWSSDQPWILSINSTTGVATKTGNGPVTITATITTGCSSVQLSRSVHAGTATPISISVNGTNCTGYSHDISITTSGSPTSFNWYASSGNAANATVLNYGGGTASFYSNIADCYGLTVSMTNSCGVSTAGTTICVDNCFSAFKVYPNPAKDYIAIQFATYNDKAAMPDQITLYDEKTQGSSNNMKAEDIFKKLDNQGILKLDVSSLPRGVYFLHISHGRQGDKKTEKVRIVLE